MQIETKLVVKFIHFGLVINSSQNYAIALKVTEDVFRKATINFNTKREKPFP